MPEKQNSQTSKPVSKSALRLLVLSPSTLAPQPQQPSLLGPLLTILTGSKPPASVVEEGGAFAGYTSHPPVQLRTKYYATDVNIWCDELPAPAKAAVSKASKINDEDEQVSLQAWKQQMCSDAAREVRSVIGAIIAAFPFDEQSMLRPAATPSPDLDEPREPSEEFQRYFHYLDVINDLRDRIEDENFGRELPLIAILQNKHLPNSSDTSQIEIQRTVDRMEEEWMATREALGWDFVGWAGDSSEQFEDSAPGLRDDRGEKSGIAKALECLELGNWNAKVDGEDGGSDVGEGQGSGAFGLREDGIKMQSHELEREMMGLKLEMMKDDQDGTGEDDGENIQVEQFQGLLERVTAIKEAALEMQGQEKSDFAKREIDRLMKDVG